jgi:hypothetical protein
MMERPLQSAFYTKEFYSEQMTGSLNSARIVLSRLKKITEFNTTIDIGAGVGAWTRAALDIGVEDAIAIDGSYVDKEQILVDGNIFFEADLEKVNFIETISSRYRRDLVISMEVAEHLHPDRALGFISELCVLSDLVLFSAAVPGQGGINHINEQWPDYWADLFKQNGFLCFDILREKIWNDDLIDWWYAQNVLVFARVGSPPFERLAVSNSPSIPLPLIHPRMHDHVLNWNNTQFLQLLKQKAEIPLDRDDEVRSLEIKIESLRNQLKNIHGKIADFAADSSRLENDYPF